MCGTTGYQFLMPCVYMASPVLASFADIARLTGPIPILSDSTATKQSTNKTKQQSIWAIKSCACSTATATCPCTFLHPCCETVSPFVRSRFVGRCRMFPCIRLAASLKGRGSTSITQVSRTQLQDSCSTPHICFARTYMPAPCTMLSAQLGMVLGPVRTCVHSLALSPGREGLCVRVFTVG